MRMVWAVVALACAPAVLAAGRPAARHRPAVAPVAGAEPVVWRPVSPVRADLPYVPAWPQGAGSDRPALPAASEDPDQTLRAGLGAMGRAGCPGAPGAVVAAVPVWRVEAGAWTPGFQQVLRLALCQDPRGRQTLARWRAEQAQVEIERAQGRPRLDAQWSGARTRWSQQPSGEDAERGRSTVRDGQLALSWLLTDFGQQGAREEVAAQGARAAGFVHDAQLQALVQEAAQAAATLLQAQLHQAWSASALAWTTSLVDGLARARPARTLEGTEALEVQLRLDRQRHTLRLADEATAQARADLALRLGLDPRTPLQLPWWTLASADEAATSSYDALLRQAAERHPLLASAQAEWRGAQAEQTLARRAQRPRVTLQGQWRDGRDTAALRSRERAIGVQIELPLWSGGEAAAQRDRAFAREQAARAGLDEARRQMAAEVWSAWHVLREQTQALQLATRLQTSAAALLDGQQRAFMDGESDLLDVVDAHDELQDAAEQRFAHLATLVQARLRLTLMLGGMAATDASR